MKRPKQICVWLLMLSALCGCSVISGELYLQPSALGGWYKETVRGHEIFQFDCDSFHLGVETISHVGEQVFFIGPPIVPFIPVLGRVFGKHHNDKLHIDMRVSGQGAPNPDVAFWVLVTPQTERTLLAHHMETREDNLGDTFYRFEFDIRDIRSDRYLLMVKDGVKNCQIPSLLLEPRSEKHYVPFYFFEEV